jgi:diguanylate cyclase (GGDEF)-like protein
VAAIRRYSLRRLDERVFAPHPAGDVVGTLRTPLETSRSGLVDPRLRPTWRLLATSFGLLGIAAIAVAAADPGRPTGLVVLALVALTVIAAGVHQRSVVSLEAARRTEAEHVARILQGLSRSATPDAIVTAIVTDLAAGTGADHIVVVRRRPDSGAFEATLAGARPGDPTTTTTLPPAGLDIAATARRGSDGWRLEERVATEFGLANTLAAPLLGDRGTVGAIVLARRGDEPWPAVSRRILRAAAVEAGAALERVESHRTAEARASTDALTGLPNRRYFDEFCALLAGRRRADDAVGILMVDIDHFKRINDRHGHDVGDAVLRAVAGAIAGAVREGDVPARFGGEEFAVLLRRPTRRVAVEVGERIRAAVAALDLRAIGPGSASVSVGVAVQADPAESIADLLARADRALYRAKRAGRDRVEAA